MNETEAVQCVFEHWFDDAPADIELHDLASTTDAKTNEDVIVAVITVPEAVFECDEHSDGGISSVVSAVGYAHTHLVDHADFSHPVEAVVMLRGKSGEPLFKLYAFRSAVTWIREHIYRNLTLEQWLALIFETSQRPDSYEQAVHGDWIPEYELDWREQDVPAADEFDAQVDYEYWSSGHVPYPGGDGDT